MNRIDIYQTKEQALLLSGIAGNIEAIFQGNPQPLMIQKRLQIGIVLHPHPLQEGTMHNKVVYTLARVFKHLAIPVLRFNFRGVGQSEGSHDHGEGETADLLHIMQQLGQNYPETDFWLAGFSFGSFIAYQAYMQGRQNYHIKHLCLVGPPMERYTYPIVDFPQNFSFALFQGINDEVVNPEVNYQWFQNLKEQQSWPNTAQLITFDTGHFFHGKLTELKESYVDLINKLVC